MRSLQDIRASIHPRLLRRSTPLGLYFLLRDLLMAACAWKIALLSTLFRHAGTIGALTPFGAIWWFQGLIFTGIWVIGRECGHGAFSDYKLLNDAVGLVTHTLLWTPYFSWTISIHRHHNNGARRGRHAVLSSNAGIGAMIIAVISASHAYSLAAVVKYYGIPWLLVTHWFILVTYLHHTTPELPHYRGREWNFQHATVHRPFLEWHDRFFLHDVAHFHVVHHLFPKMSFYHGEEATKYLQGFIGEHYAYSEKPIFEALWESYNRYKFVEDEEPVLLYRDRQGRAERRAVRV
ncbi:hypothetical protein FB107DRAFT_276101 [Schizophyllum commune]